MRKISRLLTPVGVEMSKDLINYLQYFLGSYHGGRNESFIYGMIQEPVYDYDLPGAYPTAMSMLDYPDWLKKEMILPCTKQSFLNRYGQFLLKSYTSLRVEFKFPDHVQYPVLPVRLDESSIFYPLEGESYCTGHEILLASKLNCDFKVLGGVFIPFTSLKTGWKTPRVDERGKKRVHKTDNLIKETGVGKLKVRTVIDPLITEIETLYSRSDLFKPHSKIESGPSDKPEKKTSGIEIKKLKNESSFHITIKTLVTERMRYPKGSYMNQLYKFIANSGIGQMARGLSQKRVFDTETCKTKCVEPGELISPLYAGWITSYIRCTLGEIMNNQHNSKIFSCTTDGFLTTEQGMEALIPSKSDVFSYNYYLTRERLTGKGELLELKHFDLKGLLSWRTRGQLGLSGEIKAMTGYQRSESFEELIPRFISYFKTGNKTLPFLQSGLRSAKEIFLDGGHATIKLTERWFNLRYDNRRLLQKTGESYYLSKPYKTLNECSYHRNLSKVLNYPKYESVGSLRGDAYVSLTKRMLIRICLNKALEYGVQEKLPRDEIQKILGVVGLKVLPNFFSKQRKLDPIPHSLPRTQKVLEILQKFKCIFPDFPIERILRK